MMILSRKLVEMYDIIFKKTDLLSVKKDISIKLPYTTMSCATFYILTTIDGYFRPQQLN